MGFKDQAAPGIKAAAIAELLTEALGARSNE
jgi:hypothetical protein